MTELLPISYFPGIIPSLEYVVRAHTTGLVSAPIKQEMPNSLITSSLEVRDYEIYNAFPLSSFTTEKRDRFHVSNLGLIGKMTGCAAIFTTEIAYRDNGSLILDIQLKALGVLGMTKLPVT